MNSTNQCNNFIFNKYVKDFVKDFKNMNFGNNKNIR